MQRAEKIAIVSRLLQESNSVLFITGAGISAESGLPTYRGVGGLYHDATTEEGFPIEVALSGSMWHQQPHITWRHIRDIERTCRGAQPNKAHRAIATLETTTKKRIWTLTQNVDGLHRKAGSKNVIQMHGTIQTLLCPHCGWTQEVKDFAHLPETPNVPSCPACQNPIRPDVILFGEQLPEEAVNTYDRELARGFDLIFSIGTSSQFPYIAHPVIAASHAQIPTVEINPQETLVTSQITYRFDEPCADLLDSLIHAAL